MEKEGGGERKKTKRGSHQSITIRAGNIVFSLFFTFLHLSSLFIIPLLLSLLPSHLHLSRIQITPEPRYNITVDQHQHTFSLHFPKVELCSHSVAPSTKSIYDSIINSRIWCQLSSFHLRHRIEDDVMVPINPMRRLTGKQRIVESRKMISIVIDTNKHYRIVSDQPDTSAHDRNRRRKVWMLGSISN